MSRKILSVVFLLSVNVAVTAEEVVLPDENKVIPIVKNGVAIYDPALNKLMAMQKNGCAKLDITPINYSWKKTGGEGCK